MEELGFCVDIPKGFPKVMSDSFTLEQTFANLLSNAYHAQVEKKEQIKEGKLQIDNYVPNVLISAKILGNEALVIVADNGIGMTKDQFNQVFAPYFTTKTKSGTGLGLSSIKQALEQQDCKISVESEYGKGAAFTITMPLAKEGVK